MKPKLNVPLFGKRSKLQKDFGFKKSESVKSEQTDYRSDEEEQEQEDETIEDSSNNIVETKEENIQSPSEKKKILGPTFNPKLIPTKIEDPPIKVEINKESETNVDSSNSNKRQSTTVLIEDDTAQSSSKKRRNRQRIRGKARENVDMDDAEEADEPEKFSQWVPPVNQAGDGYTELNDKFGY